ncbi:MAG: hypothetical protein M1541_21875 [Acidobacteria bacterium]|nr:hypothetical protein [Acidobacteriota bacterium]
MRGWLVPVRAWIGFGVASFLCLATSLEYYSTTTEFYRRNPDPMEVALQERRLAMVRADVRETAIIGYFSDLPLSTNSGSAAFFQALYTLAPRLLVPETTSRQPKLVLGNFHMRPDLGQLEREHGLKLIKDYGGGVRLFRRGGQ